MFSQHVLFWHEGSDNISMELIQHHVVIKHKVPTSPKKSFLPQVITMQGLFPTNPQQKQQNRKITMAISRVFRHEECWDEVRMAKS